MELGQFGLEDSSSPELFLRRRARPRRASRRSFRAPLRWAAAVAGLAGLAAAGFWSAAAAGRAPELALARIVVEGNRRLAEGEILEALGLHPGANILALDLGSLKRQLLRSAWVKDVEVSRVLPATLTLSVVERVPVGIAVLERLYLMDGEGAFLDELGPRYRDLALPLVRGLSEGGTLVPGRTELAGRILAALGRDRRLEEAVSEIDLSEGGGLIRVVLRHPPVTVLSVEGSLASRLAEILPIAEEIPRLFPSLEAVDVRFRGRIYLRLGSSASSGAVEPITSLGR